MNVPKLRFGEFKSPWKFIKLGQLGNTIAGLTYSPKDIRDSGLLVLRSSNVQNGQIDLGDCVYVDPDVKGSKISQENDILICVRNGSTSLIGKNALIPAGIPHCTHGAFMTVFRAEQPKFIHQLFQTKNYKTQVSADLGARINSINNSQLVKYQFAVPPTEYEQQKIADFLSAVDDKITALTAQKTALTQYKQSMMQRIFSQTLRFKDDNGADYPEWDRTSLSQLGTTYGGLTGKTKEDFGIGKPFITYKQVFDDSKIDISRFEHVQISKDETQNRVKRGDIIFTTSSETANEIAFSSVLLDEFDELYLNSFCFGYRPNSLETFLPEYARYLFRSEFLRKEIIMLAQGSTRYNISKNQLMKLHIPLPSMPEQTKIARFLTECDDKINAVDAQIQSAQQWKQGLLQQMFV